MRLFQCVRLLHPVARLCMQVGPETRRINLCRAFQSSSICRNLAASPLSFKDTTIPNQSIEPEDGPQFHETSTQQVRILHRCCSSTRLTPRSTVVADYSAYPILTNYNKQHSGWKALQRTIPPYQNDHA